MKKIIRSAAGPIPSRFRTIAADSMSASASEILASCLHSQRLSSLCVIRRVSPFAPLTYNNNRLPLLAKLSAGELNASPPVLILRLKRTTSDVKRMARVGVPSSYRARGATRNTASPLTHTDLIPSSPPPRCAASADPEIWIADDDTSRARPRRRPLWTPNRCARRRCAPPRSQGASKCFESFRPCP
jgi:hypothetical protein